MSGEELSAGLARCARPKNVPRAAGAMNDHDTCCMITRGHALNRERGGDDEGVAADARANDARMPQSAQRAQIRIGPEEGGGGRGGSWEPI